MKISDNAEEKFVIGTKYNVPEKQKAYIKQ